MIMDGLLLLDSAHAITAATATEASTNVVDLSNARDIGVGDPLKILCQVIAAFAGGTSLIAALQGSTDNTTYTTMVASPVTLTAALLAGRRLLESAVPRPVSGQALPRYLRMLYTTDGTFTLGTVTATLLVDREDRRDYPAGININN